MKELIIEAYNQSNKIPFAMFNNWQKLLDLLLNERISLVRLNLFDDKLEGSGVNTLKLFYWPRKKYMQNKEEP
jgi:hypothetical protein